MNALIWCAVGVLAGWVAALLMPGTGLLGLVETVLVSVFGAFIGGDFLASVLSGGAAATGGFRASSLGLALGGATVMLLLLAVLRRAVGPVRPHKVRRRSRP